MRMGVLDIGSNTGHLLVVDAFRGGPPVPAHSYKEPLRLTDHLDSSGAITEDGVERLGKYMVEAKAEAEDKGCTQILAFATSAVRDAVNADEVIRRVNQVSASSPGATCRPWWCLTCASTGNVWPPAYWPKA